MANWRTANNRRRRRERHDQYQAHLMRAFMRGVVSELLERVIEQILGPFRAYQEAAVHARGGVVRLGEALRPVDLAGPEHILPHGDKRLEPRA